jgi:hypothetical protein
LEWFPDPRDDLWRLLKSSEKEKLRYTRMWLKRMINQVIRGSFECYINARKTITETEHVMEVNQDISNADGSINMNMRALNEEMGYDSRIKEKIDINKAKKMTLNPDNLKNFIELPDADHEVVVEKEVMDLLKNEPSREENNLVIIDDDDKEEEAVKGNVNIKVKVDASSMAETDTGDCEAESEEDEVILVGNGESDEMRRYATKLFIPQSNESGAIAEERRVKAIVPADSESSD